MDLLVTLTTAALLVPVGAGGGTANDKDLQALQGEWKMTRLRVNGQDLPATTVERLAFKFEKNRFAMLLDGKPVAEGSITLDAGKNPKNIDLLAETGVSKGKTDLGIYTLDGNKLVLAIMSQPLAQTKRPVMMPKGNENDIDIMEMQRVKGVAAGNPVQQDLAQLQGEWKLVKLRSGANELPADVLNKIKIVFEKDKFFMLIDGKQVADASVTIDPTKNPKTMDLFAHSGVSKGLTDLAIYSIEGDKLLVVIFAPPFGQKKRPTEMPKGVTNDYDIMEMQRIKAVAGPVTAKQELQALQGPWKMTRLYANNIEATPQQLATLEMVVENDQLFIKAGGKTVVQSKLTLFPDKSPKAMDMLSQLGASQGKTDLAIYKLENNRLTIYLMPGVQAQQMRPTALPQPGQEKMLEFMEFERLKTN
jgi:uncharacterized protein (TIGR03067 family)